MRRMELVGLLRRSEHPAGSIEIHRFSDDFVPQEGVSVDETIEHLNASELESNFSHELQLFVQIELSEFQCSLHNKNLKSPVVVINFELATFSGDHVSVKLGFRAFLAAYQRRIRCRVTVVSSFHFTG